MSVRPCFPAMQLINDPQGFAEHLFNRLQGGSALKFDTKMLLIQAGPHPGPHTLVPTSQLKYSASQLNLSIFCRMSRVVSVMEWLGIK